MEKSTNDGEMPTSVFVTGGQTSLGESEAGLSGAGIFSSLIIS
jgi:hypothetical protein